MKLVGYAGPCLVGMLNLTIPSAATAEPLVDQFVKSCIETLPDFARLDETLQSTDFHTTSENQWGRDSDTAVFLLEEETDRLICMVGVIGDHVASMSTSLEEVLAEGKLGRYEEKSYQRRKLYLLKTQNGLTILEVIPPLGATTFLVANAQKE